MFSHGLQFEASGSALKKPCNSGAASALTTNLKWETKVKSTPAKSKIGSKAASSAIVGSEPFLDVEMEGDSFPDDEMEIEPFPSVEDRIKYLSTAAYFKAEARGFEPGKELDDWLEAEQEFAEKGGY